MKKIFLLMLVIGIMTGCSSSVKKEPIELKAGEVVEKLQNENQNSFLLYVISDKCYSCDEYQKVIDEVENAQPFEVYYLRVNTSEEDKEVLRAMDELKVVTGNVTMLPTTFYFYQGSLQAENKKEGYLEKKELIEWLRNLHILH